MSTERGNATRTRPQKHRNSHAFNNALHDTSRRQKQLNGATVSDACARCADIIRWRVKFKKYKPLTRPKTCVKCARKTVKMAYRTVCDECAAKLGICTKCGLTEEEQRRNQASGNVANDSDQSESDQPETE